MVYRFEFRSYRRKFVRSLTTSHGVWSHRDGIILRLMDETGTGWGEIAPISWFGSETLEQALDFCHQLPHEITDEMISSIPDELPACQFGFESALPIPLIPHQSLKRGEPPQRAGSTSWEPGVPHSLTYSGLLPAGEAALEAWRVLWEEGYRTFKWKIGVYTTQAELEVFEWLTQAIPAAGKLRLDANGGLSYEDAHLWLRACDHVNAKNNVFLKVEFIEQPLSVEQFEEMLELTRCYTTAIALDESIATLNQLATCYQQGWREIFVIKPGIVGSPSRLRLFCQKYEIDAVFSSVFETEIGKHAALQLAAELSSPNRAVGFGINHYFIQQENTWLKKLWNDL